MANLNRSASAYTMINARYSSSGARTTTPLNAAYVNTVSGAGVAIRYQARDATPLSEAYIFLDTVTGTLANISMSCVIYNEHASSATQTGSTVRATASSVTMPSAGVKWIKAAFNTPYTPAIGETLWIVFANTAAAPATDVPNILTATNAASGTFNPIATGFSTTNGFSTAGTALVKLPFVVGDGTNYSGSPITQQTSIFASNQLTRGIVVTAPFNMNIDALQITAGATALTGIKVFDNTTGPAGTALYSYALGTDVNQSRDEIIGSKVLTPQIQLVKGQTYKVTLTFNVNSTVPAGGQIEDYSSFSAVFDALVDGWSNCGSCVDNGASGWTINNGFIPGISLLAVLMPSESPYSFG